MAVLGDFDALTPIVTSGQQNTFDSNTFSILELTKVPLRQDAGVSHNRNSSNQEDDVILSTPVLLASFSIDNSTTGASQSNGITATCVLDHAPHQVYIGGYFKQSLSVIVQSINGSNTDATTGINYIGLYDSKLKRFLSMGNGLDGPVEALVCDSSTDQVYVVGKFRAPLQEMLSDGNSSNNSRYQTQGSFGGGVAVWKPSSQQDTNSNPSTDTNGVATQAAGTWIPLPFKGLNGVVTSVAKASDGTVYFGGQFDTTADGESFSAPDAQLVNMDNVVVTTGNGEDPLQDRNIICQSSTVTQRNWIMRGNIPGYWRAEFPLLITPTLFRLWNVDTTEESSGGAGANRGAKTFSIMAQPSNQLLNLSYIDPDTQLVQYCTTCTLLPWSTLTTVQQNHQDFLVVTPVLLHGVQIDIKSWYGQGGGLGGVEVYQSEIFVRAVDALNSASACSSPAIMNATYNDDNKDLRAFSSFLGADWVTMNMTDGWQTAMAANVSATNEKMRKQAYVDLVPYLQESGMYDVYLYTPACSPKAQPDTASSGDNSARVLPSNSCSDRGFVDVDMYFASPESVKTVTLSQTNNVDKYDKIYSGMIAHSTSDFRPHVVIGPSVHKAGTSGGGNTQSVIVDSIQFVKQATLNDTNSLLFYRPGSGSVAAGDVIKQKKDQVRGLDSSVWGTLPTQLPSAATVNSLVSYYDVTGSSSLASSLLFIGGSFTGTGYTNLAVWDGTAFVPMAPGSPSASGLDGVVYSMALHQSTLYVVGDFQQAYGAGVEGSQLGGLAMYDIQSKKWASFGNVTQDFLSGAQFQSIHLSTSVEGQPRLILEGKFTWAQGVGSSSVSVAVWDIDNQKWIREDLRATSNGGTSGKGEIPFGYVHGQISYLNRVLGSNSNVSASDAVPVVLIAGTIDSLDSYKVHQPENMAWVTSSGDLKTVNLSPAISMAPISDSGNTTFDASESIIGQVPEMPKVSAGAMYFNKDAQQWITIVGGANANGTIGAGYFNTPEVSSPSEDSMLTYKHLNLALAATSAIKGEILALGISKDEATGYASSDSADELLLIGGAFKSSGSSSVNGLALYDLAAGQVVFSNMVPTLQGVQGRNPAVHVIKSRPGNARKMLVLAGDFFGIGNDVSCELVCLWEPAEARRAIDNKESIEGSFKSIYGDSGSNSKKHLGTLKGVVNDIAFEDDKNMFVAGDLIVNGVPCGVASFNFDNYKWTTFGSMMNTTSGSNQSPGADTLTGPVTAIAHDSMFHRFFIAGRSSADGSAYFKKWDGTRFIRVSPDFMPTSDVHQLEILPASKNAPDRTAATSSSFANDRDDEFNDGNTPSAGNNINNNNNSPSATSTSSASPQESITSMDVDPNDTTYILEQGYILLVSGRIVLGTASPSSHSNQESSLAFFDGQSWFPYLQSSRNASSASTNLALTSPLLSARHAIGLDLIERAAPVADSTPTSSSSPSAAAATTSPSRVRDQGVFRALAIAHLPRIIARDYLSLPYIILISVAISLGLILLIVLFGFLFVWLERRLSKEERATRPKLGSSIMEDGHDGRVRKGGSRGRGAANSRVGPNGPYFVDSVGVSQGARFVTNTNPSKNEKGSSHREASASNGKPVYQPNSTIAQATDALVTQFVRSHQLQLASAQNPPEGRTKEQS
ncbi:hypothetical protein BGX20_010239, partial [Mortierella sp. AD010]